MYIIKLLTFGVILMGFNSLKATNANAQNVSAVMVTHVFSDRLNQVEMDQVGNNCMGHNSKVIELGSGDRGWVYATVCIKGDSKGYQAQPLFELMDGVLGFDLATREYDSTDISSSKQKLNQKCNGPGFILGRVSTYRLSDNQSGLLAACFYRVK